VKVLFYIHSLAAGGAERVTANLANHWAGKGCDVSIATVESATFDFYPLDASVKRFAFELSGASAGLVGAIAGNFRRIMALRRLIRTTRPDVVIAMMTMSNIQLALARVGLREIVAIGSERTHPPKMPLGAIWERLRKHSYRFLDSVVALTQESKLWLESNTNARHVVVIPNAVQWPMAKNDPVIDSASRVGADRTLVLAVGRLDQYKGFDLLIPAFASLTQDFPKWDLAILGEGPERSKLEALIEREGVVNRVHLLGRAGNVGDWYERADLYVMSSRFEGFPNTLIEAMAAGLPVLSFDCDTGPRDIIRPDCDGVLVSDSDGTALAAAMRRLMSDSVCRRRLGTRAREVTERFSMAAVASKWDAEIIGRSPPRSIGAER
jgi:glycosyltransferase involved in cell wall biosynthesis